MTLLCFFVRSHIWWIISGFVAEGVGVTAQSIFDATKRNVAFNGNTITANYNTFVNSYKSQDSYKTVPFDMIDPEVYKTRTDRYELVRMR